MIKYNLHIRVFCGYCCTKNCVAIIYQEGVTMKIAIVEDEKIFQDTLREYILTYNEDYELSIYSNANDFLLNDYSQYSIVFLDIELSGQMNGVELANKIKENNDQTLIFFTTSYPTYITSAMRVMPFQYLIKPIDEKLFMEEFDRAVKFLAKRESLIDIKTYNGIEQVKIGDIIYIEYFNRKIEIHTQQKILYSYGTMKNLLLKVADYNFVKCHASFIVNLDSVKYIKRYYVELKNNTKIPISKKEFENTRAMFAKYKVGE